MKSAGKRIYYHVICDIPKSVGEHIILDKTHSNGVYKRVYEQLAVVQDIYRNPEKYRGAELPHAVDVALRELALEQVRKKNYSQYPSRVAALYVSKTLKEAEQWGDYFGKLGRSTYGIAKIGVNGHVFEGDAYKCFDGSVDKAENLRMAELYWRNGPNEDGREPIVEILADGDIEVLEIVKEIHANID